MARGDFGPSLARALSAAAFFCGTVLPIDGEAAAAVRLCKPVASSGLMTAPTEIEAKKAALDAWKAKALAHGETYASWRLAADRLLQCLPHKDGYECLAKGAPCTIEQAPDRRELRRNRIDM